MNILIEKYVIGLLATVMCLLQNDLRVDAMRPDDGLEVLFRERSQSDWENVWHSESHSRCRDKLVRHLYWACEKDIYRLNRRNQKRVDESIMKRSKPYNTLMTTWINPDLARTLLRTRRSNSQSITSECCTRNGCTWEEYAEYCPSNKRRNHH